MSSDRGQVVGALETIGVLNSEGGLIIEANVPEADIGRIVVDGKAEVDLDAFPNQKFEAKVVKIAPGEVIIDGARTQVPRTEVLYWVCAWRAFPSYGRLQDGSNGAARPDAVGALRLKLSCLPVNETALSRDEQLLALLSRPLRTTTAAAAVQNVDQTAPVPRGRQNRHAHGAQPVRAAVDPRPVPRRNPAACHRAFRRRGYHQPGVGGKRSRPAGQTAGAGSSRREAWCTRHLPSEP